MNAKKTSRKSAAKRASKDLAPRKSTDVKGGSFDLGHIVGSIVKAVVPMAIDSAPSAAPTKPTK